MLICIVISNIEMPSHEDSWKLISGGMVMKNKRIASILMVVTVLATLLLLLSRPIAAIFAFLDGGVGGPNMFVDTADPDGNIAGFWLGFLHGTISPITLCVSLFKDNISIYEVHNNGAWYNFGFIISALGLGGIGKKMID